MDGADPADLVILVTISMTEVFRGNLLEVEGYFPGYFQKCFSNSWNRLIGPFQEPETGSDSHPRQDRRATKTSEHPPTRQLFYTPVAALLLPIAKSFFS